MSALRDEMARIITDALNAQGEEDRFDSPYVHDESPGAVQIDGWVNVMGIAEAIIDAGYSKPRVVTTVAELDALPVGAVVRQDPEDGERVEHDDGSWGQGAVAEMRLDLTGRKAWFIVGSSIGFRSHQADILPATVLFAPVAPA